MDTFGEDIYRLIPSIKSAVDRERLLQKWTNGKTTSYLLQNYVNRNKSILLEWSSQKMTCVLHVYQGIFELDCIASNSNYPQLMLNKHGVWEKRNVCNQCMLLFTTMNNA